MSTLVFTNPKFGTITIIHLCIPSIRATQTNQILLHMHPYSFHLQKQDLTARYITKICLPMLMYLNQSIKTTECLYVLKWYFSHPFNFDCSCIDTMSCTVLYGQLIVFPLQQGSAIIKQSMCREKEQEKDSYRFFTASNMYLCVLQSWL